MSLTGTKDDATKTSLCQLRIPRLLTKIKHLGLLFCICVVEFVI